MGDAAVQPNVRFTLWVRRHGATALQYASLKGVDAQTTVEDVKERWANHAKLEVTDLALFTLRLAKCGTRKPTPAEEVAAVQLDDPSLTLAEAGITGTAWLLAETAGHGEVAAALASLHVSVEGSPSSFCDSKLCAKVQSNASTGPAFECFRPFVGPPRALPASLVSPIFGAFLRDCEADLASLGRCDLESNCAMALLKAMPNFYKLEKDRQVLVNNALEVLLGCDLTLFQPNPAESASRSDGGIVLTLADMVRVLVLLTEHKNEMSGGDPYFQLQRTHQVFWQAPGCCGSDLHCTDCCPALALEFVGPLMRVNALASLHANRVLCEPLTPFLPVLQLRDQPAAMARLVVTLRAVRNAVERLHTHYQACRRDVSSSPRPAVSGVRDATIALPYALRDSARFSHVLQLCDDKLLYAARDATRDGALVCVKFSRRGYGQQVHAAWAEVGHAPALYESTLLPGGLTMVVMELLARTDGWLMLRDVAEAAADAAWAAARAALRAAHDTPLPDGSYGVHGDCRDINVLVRQDTGAGAWEVRFVDFDGAGAEGQRLYPPFMSPAVQWPAGALPGMPLQRAHDTDFMGRKRAS